MNIEDTFKKYNENDYLKFELVKNKRSTRADLHAFLLLDELVPGTHDIVSYAEHDEIFLSIDARDLEKAGISEEQIHELVCCGVMYDAENDSLSMFV